MLTEGGGKWRFWKFGKKKYILFLKINKRLLSSLCAAQQQQASGHLVKENKITWCLYVMLILVPCLKAHGPLAPWPRKEQHINCKIASLQAKSHLVELLNSDCSIKTKHIKVHFNLSIHLLPYLLHVEKLITLMSHESVLSPYIFHYWENKSPCQNLRLPCFHCRLLNIKKDPLISRYVYSQQVKNSRTTFLIRI